MLRQSENPELTGDRSLDDPCPKAVFSTYHSGNPNGSEQEETHHMVTGVQEEIPYCSPETPSGKQRKARSTSQQPQLRIENTPATIEADQKLLALQQVTTNSNSVNINKNINRISKLPKSLTTMPTFDGKSENFELFED